ARGAKELDVAPSVVGLWAAGGSVDGATDQRPLQRGVVGSAPEFFPALDEAKAEMAGRQPLGTAPRSTPDRLSTIAGQRSGQRQKQAAAARSIRVAGPI